MAFTYKKYKELVKEIDYISKELKKQNKDNYDSFKVQDHICELISKANSINSYIRHSKINRCILKGNVKHNRYNFGRGKKFNFKYIGNNKVLIFKKGFEEIIAKEEFNDKFEICAR